MHPNRKFELLAQNTVLAFAASFGLLSFATPASPQAIANARIHGVVTDNSGAVVPEAIITATQTASGAVITARSSSAGDYTLPTLPVGPYVLSVTAKGFQTYQRSGILLQVSNDVQVDVTMEVGSVGQTVVVNTAASAVQTEENSISTVVDSQRISELPLNGRNAASLVLLSGGAQPTQNGNMTGSKTYGNSGPSAIGGALNISVAGGVGNSLNFILDGGDHNDSNYSVNMPLPFPDALQEFSVQTTGLSAQYGLHPGATINAVTKSGGNEWHGGVFEFLRNNYANAKDRVSGQLDQLKRNQFGGELGGPILRNKLFFFGGYQGTRLRITPSTSTANIPTSAMVAGNWTPYFQYLEGTGACPFSQTASAATKAKYASLLQAGFALDSVGCTASISPALYSPTAKNLMKYLPTSTTLDPTGTVKYGVSQPQNENQWIGRIDVNLSAKHNAFARYFMANYSSGAYFNGNLLNVINTGLTDRAKTLTIGDNYSITPTIVNGLRLTASRLAIRRSTPPDLVNFTSLGANVYSYVPNFMYVSVSGGFTAACGSCAPANIDTNMPLQIADDVSMTHGAHYIQAGVDILRQGWNNGGVSSSNGQFTFSGVYSGYALADLLLGASSQFVQAAGGNITKAHVRQQYSGYYIQDTWHATRNLTLNYGLRWEPTLPAVEKDNKGQSFSMDNFNAGLKSTVYVNAPAGLIFNGDKGVPRGFLNKHYLMFSPRVGFAYAPAGSLKQSIRGSYSLVYDTPTTVFVSQNWAPGVPYGNLTTLALNLTTYKDTFTNPWQQVPGGNPFPIAFPTPNAAFPTSGLTPQEDPANQRRTYVHQYNLSYEVQPFNSWLFSAHYVGTHTLHLWGYIPVNYGLNQSLLAKDGGGAATTSNTALRYKLYLATAGTGAGATYGAFNSLGDYGMANYSGLILSANHRMSNNFSLLANYTYSHCLTNVNYTGDNSALPQNPTNPSAEYGSCNWDITHGLTVSGVYTTPKLSNRWLNSGLGSWKASGLLARYTGTPVNITTGGNNSLTGIGQDRPDVVPGVSRYAKNLFPASGFPIWLNTMAFTSNAVGTYGNEQPFSTRGPSFVNLNTSLSKVFPIRERLELEIRGEAFNLLNHPNYANPVTAMNSTSTFGRITSTSTSSSPRLLEIAAKVNF